MTKLNWGILSTANIGIKRIIPAIVAGNSGVVAAIASRDAAKAGARRGGLSHRSQLWRLPGAA